METVWESSLKLPWVRVSELEASLAGFLLLHNEHGRGSSLRDGPLAQ